MERFLRRWIHHYQKAPATSLGSMPKDLQEQLTSINPSFQLGWWSRCTTCGSEHPGEGRCYSKIQKEGFICGEPSRSGFWAVYETVPMIIATGLTGNTWLTVIEPRPLLIHTFEVDELTSGLLGNIEYRALSKYELIHSRNREYYAEQKQKQDIDDLYVQVSQDPESMLLKKQIRESLDGMPATGSFLGHSFN